jgi:hypothetical protein
MRGAGWLSALLLAAFGACSGKTEDLSSAPDGEAGGGNGGAGSSGGSPGRSGSLGSAGNPPGSLGAGHSGIGGSEAGGSGAGGSGEAGTPEGGSGATSSRDGGRDGGTVVQPDGRVCPATDHCPLFSGLPTKAVITCDSHAECPACLPRESINPCATPGLSCEYTGANLYFVCTCQDIRGELGAPPDAASPDGGPVLGFRCLG